MYKTDLDQPFHPELVSIANDIRARPQQRKFFSPLVLRLVDYIIEFENGSNENSPYLSCHEDTKTGSSKRFEERSPSE
jgi:hypothetical protein